MALTSVLSFLFDWSTIGVLLVIWLFIKTVQHDILSPLANVPGPRLFILRKLNLILGIVYKDMPQRCLRQFQKYGPIVRFDSDSVMVVDADAVVFLYSSGQFRKADSYKAMEFHQDNIFSTRDAGLHKKLKRIISPAFSTQAIAEMEPLVYEIGVENLVKRIDEFSNSGVAFDLLQYLNYMTLDIIGEITFEFSFSTLLSKPGDSLHQVTEWIHHISDLGMLKFALGPLCNQWLFPKHFSSEKKLVEFTRTAVQNCKANIAFKYSNNSRKSILNRLVEAVDIDTNEKLSEDQLIAESIVQLIAGTETTSLTLMWTIYLLLQNPETYHLLVDELYKALPDQQSSISHAEIKGLSYLNAVLYESMRLRPVVPTGSPRQVPLGGATICGFHIPEKYVTYPVTYIVHHLDSVFGPDPQEFRPSRWLDSSSEQLAVMRQTFLGFSIGTRACVGRNLAWLELRLTLAVLIRRFDFSVPEDAKVNMTPALEFVLKPRARQFLVKAESRPT